MAICLFYWELILTNGNIFMSCHISGTWRDFGFKVSVEDKLSKKFSMWTRVNKLSLNFLKSWTNCSKVNKWLHIFSFPLLSHTFDFLDYHFTKCHHGNCKNNLHNILFINKFRNSATLHFRKIFNSRDFHIRLRAFCILFILQILQKIFFNPIPSPCLCVLY